MKTFTVHVWTREPAQGPPAARLHLTGSTQLAVETEVRERFPSTYLIWFQEHA